MSSSALLRLGAGSDLPARIGNGAHLDRMLSAQTLGLAAGGGDLRNQWVTDAARLFAGEVLEGLIGVIVAGAILYVLSRPKISGVFER
jgi:hypothetical protein